MASLRIRQRKDGSAYTSVLFREDGKQSSVSTDDHAQAVRFKKLVEQVGPAEARRIAGIEDETADELTVAEFLEEFVESLSGIEPATIHRYKSYIKNDINPFMGSMPLTSVGGATISKWVAHLEKSGSAGKTIANKHAFLAGAFNAAVRLKKVPSSPCVDTRIPKTHKEEMVFLTADEFRAIREQLDAKWRPLATWLVTTGTRFGEATALRVGDINMKTNTCRITRAWKYTNDKSDRLGPPKSTAGIRTISLPPEAVDELDLDRPRTTLLFTDRGARIKSDYFREYIWKPAVAKANIAQAPRVHDLRHTCASWMIAAGVPLPVIQAHLGHESITVTVGTYGHLDRTSHNAAAAAISSALSGPSHPRSTVADATKPID